MTALALFVRNTPVKSLRRYFDSMNITFPQTIKWDASDAALALSLLTSIEYLREDVQSRICQDADRVMVMSDPGGQAVLDGVVGSVGQTRGGVNAWDRALTLLLDDPAAFRRAEEARYTDVRRHGSLWDGFVAPAERSISTEGADRAAFERDVAELFGDADIQVDIFTRTRTVPDRRTHRIVQVQYSTPADRMPIWCSTEAV